MAVDAGGIGPAGATNGVIGAGATVFRMRVPTTLGAQAGTIANQIGPPWGSVVRNLVGARSQAGEKASSDNSAKAE